MATESFVLDDRHVFRPPSRPGAVLLPRRGTKHTRAEKKPSVRPESASVPALKLEVGSGSRRSAEI